MDIFYDIVKFQNEFFGVEELEVFLKLLINLLCLILHLHFVIHIFLVDIEIFGFYLADLESNLFFLSIFTIFSFFWVFIHFLYFFVVETGILHPRTQIISREGKRISFGVWFSNSFPWIILLICCVLYLSVSIGGEIRLGIKLAGDSGLWLIPSGHINLIEVFSAHVKVIISTATGGH